MTVQVKAPISGWHYVTEEQAKVWAVTRYEHMTCRFKAEYINSHLLRGISFAEEELINECNFRRASRHAEKNARVGTASDDTTAVH